MKVFVLCIGEYSQRGASGVYSSLDKAQAAIPGVRWARSEYNGYVGWDALEYPDSADIECFEVDADRGRFDG